MLTPVATSLPIAPPPPPGRFEGTLIGLPMVMEAKCTVTLPDGTPYTVPINLAFDRRDGFGFTLEMDSLYRELDRVRRAARDSPPR